MRTIIVSLSLFAVVLAYIALSPNDKPTKTTSQKTMAEEKAGNKGKTTSPRSARQKAGEADWAAVHAIAAEYAPQLKELERERNKEEDSVIGSYEPELAEYVTKDEYKSQTYYQGVFTQKLPTIWLEMSGDSINLMKNQNEATELYYLHRCG